MAIDDPVSALQESYSSEERQRSPVSLCTKAFLTIAKILAPPGTEFTFDAAIEWLSGRTESKWQDFVDVFASEMRYCTANVQKLICENEAQRRFIEDELPGLTVEALRRAEECRAKERVARLAQILSHAASTGARDGADLIEDMMAVATRLSELDVLVLHRAVVDYKAETSAHPQEAHYSVAVRVWKRIPEKINHQISDDALVTVGSKLESFGLVTKLETGAPWDTSVFRPLEHGSRFIEYIRSTQDQWSGQ